jgi:hypothetical protein
MKKKDPKKKSGRPKRILRLPDLEHSWIAVLSPLSSPDSPRSYRFAIDDFVTWYCSGRRLAFNKTVVLRYRLQLEARHLASSAITTADANSFFHTAFGRLFIRMNSIGFDCRHRLLVKRGHKLRCCAEVQNCGREQTWKRYTAVVRDAKIETLV